MDKNDLVTTITGDIQLAMLVEGAVVPVIIGAVKSIQKLVEGETITYTVVLTTGKANLDASAANFTSAIQLINTERAKVGLPPLAIPGQ